MPKKVNLLRYTDGPRRNVKRQYLNWRKLNGLPDRCDNTACQFHSGPLVWNGQEVQMNLDHANGINTDNRAENLRLLCPICDSQNKLTKGGANRGRPSKSAGGFGIFDKASGRTNYVLPAQGGTYVLKAEAKVRRSSARKTQRS